MKAVARLLQVAAAACALSVGAQTPPIVTHVVEFANAITGRHVWLADPAEIAAVEAGAAGAGWARNGYYFDTSSQNDATRVDVCRFYAPGPHSHFFTANAQECNDLRANGQGWFYEKVAFRAHPPPAEFGCGGGTIYRLYNNRWMYNDSAHRFTPDRALRKRLIEEGWGDEGIAFCVEGSGRETQRSWVAQSRGDGPRTDCEDPASNLGTCVMIRKLPAMPNTLPLPVGDLGLLTGFNGIGTLFTSQPVEDTAAIRANSFVQVSRATTTSEPPWQFGFQLVGANRVASDLATMGVVHQFPTSAPVPSAQTDERVFPWSDGREHDLGLAFQIRVEVNGYPDDVSQSYGLGLLRFQDRTTGHALMVTLQAWGRNPPANMVLRDLFTGQPIVTTFFPGSAIFGSPSFGYSEGAGYALCDTNRCFVSGVHLSYLPYAFRIARADFLKVIAMARQVDPALSGDPADYMVSSFQFRGETYLDAAVAFAVYRLTLSLSK